MTDAMFFAIAVIVFVLWFVRAKRYALDAGSWLILVAGCVAIALVALIVPVIW